MYIFADSLEIHTDNVIVLIIFTIIILIIVILIVIPILILLPNIFVKVMSARIQTIVCSCTRGSVNGFKLQMR